MIRVRQQGLMCGLILGLLLCNVVFAAKEQTLSEAVFIALRHHPDVLRARAAVRAAKARTHAAIGGFLPTLDVSFARGYENTDTRLINDKNLMRQENSIALTQSIFTGFDTFYQVKSQIAERRASDYQLGATKQRVAFGSVSAFIAVLQAEDFVVLGKSNVTNHQQIFDKIDARFRVGVAHRGDKALINGRKALANERLQELKQALADSQADYLALIGEPVPVQGLIKPTDKPAVPNSLADAIYTALHKNFLLQSAQYNLTADQAKKAQRRSPFFPQLTVELRASANHNLDGTPGKNNDQLALLQLRYNLFNGTVNWANLQEASAQQVQSMHNLSRTRRDVIAQVSKDWNRYVAAKERLQYLKMHFESSQVVLDVYKKEYMIGLRQLLNVLDEEVEKFNAQLAYIRGQNTELRSRYQLLASMGTLVAHFMPMVNDKG